MTLINQSNSMPKASAITVRVITQPSAILGHFGGWTMPKNQIFPKNNCFIYVTSDGRSLTQVLPITWPGARPNHSGK